MTTNLDRLPEERTYETTRGKLIVSLIAVIAIVLGVNQWAVAKSPWHERTYDGMIVQKKWDLASSGASAGGIVVIGDSSGNFAVSTDVLEAAFGREAHNLCTYGRFQVMGASWFLDRALETGSLPSMVLVVIGTRTHALRPDGFRFAQIPIAIGSWSSRVPGVGLGLKASLQFMVARALPLMIEHPSFQQSIISGRWTINADVLKVEPHGTTLLPYARPESVEGFANKVLGEIAAQGGVAFSPREKKAIAGLIADADERGYDLVFVEGPIWSGLATHESHKAFMDRVNATLDEACAASPRAFHVGGGLQLFELPVLENPYHLMPAAAKVYSEELVRRLRALGLPK